MGDERQRRACGIGSDGLRRDADALSNFVDDLVRLKARAGGLRLWRTMHALDDATQECGWEIAVQRDPKQEQDRDRYIRQRNAPRAKRG